MEEDIRKQGMLFLQQQRFGKVNPDRSLWVKLTGSGGPVLTVCVCAEVEAGVVRPVPGELLLHLQDGVL